MKTVQILLLCITFVIAEYIYFHAWDHGLHVKSDGGLFSWTYNFETNSPVSAEVIKQHSDNLSKLAETGLVEAKKAKETPTPSPTATLMPMVSGGDPTRATRPNVTPDPNIIPPTP